MLHEDNLWNLECIRKAVKEILEENNTLFDDLIKNVENELDFEKILLRF